MEVARGARTATWELWRRPIETTPCLTDSGRAAAQWAVDKVSNFLGDAWLQAAMAGTVGSWLWAPWNRVPHTYRRIIDLGARIATLEPARRWQDLRRLARQRANWQDVLLQLEVAGFAARDGWDVELEPSLASGKRADLRLTRGRSSFLVESTLLGLSQGFQQVNEYSDRTMSALRNIASRNGLAVSGELQVVIPDEALKGWLKSVETTAESLGRSRLSAVIEVPGGGRIKLEATPTSERSGLSGPRHVGDETRRLVRTLDRKARQGSGEEPLWIRLDEGGAIWHLSLPSVLPNRREMHDRLATVILEVVDRHPHVAGVVMSEQPMAGTGGGGLERWTLAGGRAVGLRQPVAFGFGRETVVVAGTESFSAEQMGAWISWYEEEPTWLDWALSVHGQGAVAGLFVQPS